MGGSFSTIPVEGLLIIGSIIVIALTVIGIMIKAGWFSEENDPMRGNKPYPRTNKFQPFNWCNGWANWKSEVYKGKELKAETAYLGHQILEISKDLVVIRSNSFLYAIKTLLLLIFGTFYLVIILIISSEYLNFHNRGGVCPNIDYSNGDQIVIHENLKGNFKNYIYREYCYVRNSLFHDKRFNTFEKKFLSLLSETLLIFYIFILLTFLVLWLIFYRSSPPIVFDRKKRLIFTQLNGSLYISDWDRTFYSFRANGIAFELYHLNTKGEWESKWFSIAAHHYFGETNDFLLKHRAIRTDRSHAMRAWLILYMEKGELAVHPVLPFKGILDYMTPRQERLDVDIDKQVEDLLAKVGEAPGEAEKVRTPSKEIQQLLKRNNDLDLYDILSEKNLAKYIALRDAKANEKS